MFYNVNSNTKLFIYKFCPKSLTYEFIGTKEFKNSDRVELDNKFYYILVYHNDDNGNLLTHSEFLYPSHLKNLVSFIEHKISYKYFKNDYHNFAAFITLFDINKKIDNECANYKELLDLKFI